MASIADVFFQALLEDKELQVQAQKSGDKAGETLGGRMSKGISTAMRAGLGVVAGAAGIATKGLMELDEVTAQFTADTGASADEAKAAGKAINEMAGRNLQPMAEIGEALGKVHTDLGLTGEAAEKTTEDFLKFARVTGRDAATEVAAFDDILDAWGLTAEDSVEIMDKLVASHQEYGGSIEANEAALASMAPQLRALNLDIDDGIGLLNLFASSGLDAAQIPKALNSAIQKLNGKPLNEFIAELAAIEDPGIRAQRAIEVFGSKAGVQLANAIKPGMRSLDAFKVTTEEARGATEEARDALDSTFGNWLQLKINGVTSKLIELGGAFGPVLTGVASLASLGGALRLDRFVGPIVKAMAQAGKAGGEALIDAIGTATGAAGTVIGNLVAQALDPHNPFLNGIIGRSASRIGLLWSKVFGAAAAVGTALANVFLKLPGVSALRAAVLASAIKIGTLSGTAMGTAAGLAFRLGFVGALASVAEDVHKATLEIARSIRETLGIEFGTDLHPEQWEWPFGPKRPAWMPDALATSLGMGDQLGGAVAQGVQNGLDSLSRPGEFMDTWASDLVARLHANKPAVDEGFRGMLRMPPGAGRAVAIAARQAAQEATKAFNSAIRGGWDEAQTAWETFLEARKHPINRAKRIAKLEGRLMSAKLAEGLTSGDPLLRAAAEQAVAAIEAELALLEGDAEKEGKKAGKAHAKGLESEKPTVGRAAQRVVAAARGKMTALKADAYGYGWNTGTAYAAGLIAALAAKKGTLIATLRGYRTAVAAGSPPKPGAVLYGIDKFGAATGEAYVDPLIDQLRRGVATMRDTLRGALSIPIGTPAVAMAGAAAMGAGAIRAVPVHGGASTGLTINGGIHVNVRGGVTNAETGNAVRQGVHDAMADVLRQQTARLPTGSRS